MNNWKWFLLMFVIGALATGLAFGIMNAEQIKVLNKAMNTAFVLTVHILYKIKFNGKNFDVDKNISLDPMATAIDGGALVLAVAVAVGMG